MLIATLALIVGLALLVWSADRFVEGASAVAAALGMPPLLIGMVIIGFGTSAPEMVVSAQAALQGNPGIALGNAYGSNITNIALILGVTAILCPIAVPRGVLGRELPLLLGATALAAFQLRDGWLSRLDAAVLLAVFALFMAWTVSRGLRDRRGDAGAQGAPSPEIPCEKKPLGRSIVWTILGLGLLIMSSRLLVFGAVELASFFGVSDLVIGLTIVAIGTSLPELASSVIAARKGKNDLALGNILGSNVFNTLAVVGIAGVLRPTHVEPGILERDLAFVGGLTLALCVMGLGLGGRPGRINRIEGGILVASYAAYLAHLLLRVTSG